MIGKWRMVVLLSIIIIVPVVLITGFILIREKPTPERVTGEAVAWEIERPDVDWDIWETVQNVYRDGNTNISFNFFVDDYDINDPLPYMTPYLTIVMETKGNISEGFVEGLRISFVENYNWSQVNILEEPDYDIRAENLQTRNVVDYVDGTGGLGESSKGYVEAVGVNKPIHVYYRIGVHWILQSPQSQSHEMEVSLEFTYNNGTVLKEAVLPVVLKLALDAGDTLETAKEIGFGNYTGWHHVWNDPEDFFRVWMDEGKTVKVQLRQRVLLGIILDLYLYNPLGDLVASSCSKIRNHTEEITYTINHSGLWYIQVINADSAGGLYILSIQES